MRKFPYFLTFIQFIVLVLSLSTDWYTELSLILFGTLLVGILDKLGKGIVLREIIAGFGCLVSLLMPALGYNIFNQEYRLAYSFVRYMQVDQDTYFQFVLPALTAFSLAICWPVTKGQMLDEGDFMKNVVARIRTQLKDRGRIGFGITIMGILSLVVLPFLPAELKFVFALMFFSAFVGVLYLYFSPSFPYKRLLMLLFLSFITINAILTGIFTILAYMGITLISFFFIGKKISFLTKTLFLIAGFFVLFLIQSVKETYRGFTWTGKYTGNKVGLFSELINEKLSSNSKLFSRASIFAFYYRANQGFNISLVMERIPSEQPFDNGEYLFKSFASAFVPRVLWPGKPKAGGNYNMEHYAGRKIVGWSTNVSPLGEAYGNFGVAGGIIYMFFLGLFIRFVYRKILVLTGKYPLLLLWIPLLFYQTTYSMETDSLQIVNSMLKGALMIWLLSKIIPFWFGISKGRQQKRFVPDYTAN